MPDATITSTASTFGTISGTFAADQSTVTGTITAITGTVDGSVGVPGPAGPAGAAGQGVAAGGNTGQVLQKLSATSYDTGWLTLPADYINSVTAPLSVASGNLSVNLSAYLPLAGGIITGDIQSNNGSGYRSYDGLFNQVNLSATIIQLLKSGGGGGALSVEWDGITFLSGKQTVHYPGAATLFANSVLTGSPIAPTPDTSDNDTSIATTAFVKAQGYLTSAPVTSVAGRTGAITLSNTDISGLGSLAVVNDAPSNGSQYARKNAAWDVVIPGDRYLTTSTTSNTIGNGNKTFTIGTGLSYTPTQNITISYDASNHMHGEVLTYNSGTGVLTVDINHHTGSGTYASWVVNVGGVTPATSVAWGAITGTLSTQTDLQNALDLKLDVTTAASTYYLQTNPSGFIDASALTGYATETFVTTQGYITQGTADGLYYPLSGNPSGFLTSVPPPSLTNLTSDISWDGSANTGRLLIAGVNDIGSGNTEARLNFISGVPNLPATGDFWTNGTDFFYRESGSTKTIASQTYVNAQGFITSSALTPYAPLAGATFTGKVNMAAPTAGSASLNLGVGTAPTTSVAGDIWIAANINFRASDGTLKAVANNNTANTFSQPQVIQSPLATTTAALRVTQLGTGNAIEVEDSTTPDATRFVVDQFGKVGIGVAPDATAALKLDANGIKFNDGTTQTTAPVAGPTYVNVQVFGGPASSGAFTWNKPTGAKTVEVLMMSGGGGGGSGARQATSAGRFGGGGGGGAGGLYFKIDADALASSETVTVGAGGNGGAAITADTTNGNPGTKGGNSVFGPITCRGGNFGGGGTDTTGAAGATSLWYQWISNVQTVNNRGGVAPAAAPGITHELFACATGGGGGASRNATVTSASAGGSGGNKLASAGGGVESGLTSAITGGAGGIGGTSTPAVAGTNGTEYWGGTGGGGGGYRPSAVGDSGAAGGWPGGGGGGGGCSDNTFNSGAGAAGGNGVVVIITYCS